MTKKWRFGNKINSAFVGNVFFFTKSTEIFTDLGMSVLLSYQCNDTNTAVGYTLQSSVWEHQYLTMKIQQAEVGAQY